MVAREVTNPGDGSVWKPGEESVSRSGGGLSHCARRRLAKMSRKMDPGFDSLELFGALGNVLTVFVQQVQERRGREGDAENVGNSLRAFAVRETEKGGTSCRRTCVRFSF